MDPVRSLMTALIVVGSKLQEMIFFDFPLGCHQPNSLGQQTHQLKSLHQLHAFCPVKKCPRTCCPVRSKKFPSHASGHPPTCRHTCHHLPRSRCLGHHPFCLLSILLNTNLHCNSSTCLGHHACCSPTARGTHSYVCLPRQHICTSPFHLSC